MPSSGSFFNLFFLLYYRKKLYFILYYFLVAVETIHEYGCESDMSYSYILCEHWIGVGKAFFFIANVVWLGLHKVVIIIIKIKMFLPAFQSDSTSAHKYYLSQTQKWEWVRNIYSHSEMISIWYGIFRLSRVSAAILTSFAFDKCQCLTAPVSEHEHRPERKEKNIFQNDRIG